MLLGYQNLDTETREHMLSEIQADIESSKLYISPKTLSQKGKEDYPDLLKQAAQESDDEWLAKQLSQNQRLNQMETYMRNGVERQKRVRHDANEMLAMGEFNRFYIRALCLRAISEDRSLVIYRARESSNPRPESQAMIGKTIDPNQLLKDLRENPGVDTVLGLPPGPNSGLTVKLGNN